MGWIRNFCESRRSAGDVLDECVKAVERRNPRLNALIGVETPLARAEALKSLEAKKGRKLYGVPMVLKDNLCVRGWEVTCASRILKGHVARYTATAVQRLLDEGAVLLGRANMDEFAFGSSCETSCYGPTRNPRDEERSPGGSSGGSAAAVAAGFVPAALGSDTGGSIRQPAAFCGVVGLKPTYGRVSRHGLVAFASSLDQIGPFAATVEDAALVLEVIAGKDDRDSTSADVPVPEYSKLLGRSIKGLKIGIPREYLAGDLEPEIRASFDAAVKVLSEEGADVTEVSLPHTGYAVSVYYVVAPCEASSNLARFDGIRYGRRSPSARTLAEVFTRSRHEGFGAEAKRRILLGTYALSSGYYDAYYLKAMRVRRRMIEDFHAAFKRVDLLATPTAPSAAFRLGEKLNDPIQMYLSDIFTIPANLSGVPAVSIPCGRTKSKLPVGLQLMGRAFDEATLLNAAYVYQEKAGHGL